MHRLRDQNKLVHSGNQYFVNPGVAIALDPILTDEEPHRTDEAFPPASFPAEGTADHTSPNPAATGKGENREMSLIDGSRQGDG